MKIAMPFQDRFTDGKRAGKVVGQTGPDGIVRQGVDVEKVISIDHGALRIQPLIKPGWGRSGLVYGPFRRENGLAFATLVLNGHNTSQTGDLTQNILKRLLQWAKGSETAGIPTRLLQWARSKQKWRFGRQLLRWARIAWDHRKPGSVEIDENMAVGWFCKSAPARPSDGNTFTIHATGAENGEVWAQVGSDPLPLIRGLQNIPVLYLVLLREQGAAYYVSSLPNTHGMAPYPHMRPVAIDPTGNEAELYAGLYQSVLGQVGFRVDTRVHGAQVEKLAQYSSWYGTAQVADRMDGSGALEDTPAEMGGNWQVAAGQFERTAGGTKPTGHNNQASIDPGQVSGLINLLVDLPTGEPAEVGLIWRMQNPGSYWIYTASSSGCRLEIVCDGERSQVAVSSNPLKPAATNILQILDDGKTITASLNGKPAFGTQFLDERLANGTRTGIFLPEPYTHLRIHSFEVHPRTIPIPTEIRVSGPALPTGEQIRITDDFDGPEGDLAGHRTSQGGKVWQKELGPGRIELTGAGASRVKASVLAPNPGRTAYTIDWDHPEFTDVQVEITPPGEQRYQQESGRGGLIFWQDPENYLAVSTWLDDYYDGTSISSFFHLGSFEELYDAVWTNVGRRVIWGKPYTMRVTFDGLLYTATIDDEPVLQRALTDVYPEFSRLAINKIGIVANWEWGNDTGSAFRKFIARSQG